MNDVYVLTCSSASGYEVVQEMTRVFRNFYDAKAAAKNMIEDAQDFTFFDFCDQTEEFDDEGLYSFYTWEADDSERNYYRILIEEVTVE